MATRRRAVLAAAGTIAVAMTIASAAWACTEFLRIDAVSPLTQAPARTTTVSGSGAKAGSTVQVLWNSERGAVIGHAQADANGAFSVVASIPATVPADTYVLVVTDGQTPIGRAAIDVGQARADVGHATPRSADFATFAKGPSVLERTGQMAAGAGPVVLGLGMVALISAFTLVAVRRRRVLAN